MKGDFERVMNTYDLVCEQLDEPEGSLAAAVLTACIVAEDITSRMIESWSHELALGIRKGLFGKDAPPNVSIGQWIDLAYHMAYPGCACEK